MSDSAIPRPPSPRTCPLCEVALAEDARFCPSCGTRAIDPSMLSTVEAYVKIKLDQEVAKRFTDQISIAREIADKAEDVVWRRLRYFGLFLGTIGILLSALGVKSINDVTRGIEEKTAGNVEEVKGRLNRLGCVCKLITARAGSYRCGA
jgi:hypothetical protein